MKRPVSLAAAVVASLAVPAAASTNVDNPSDYDRQWVNVSGLRGCFAFVMRVDPENLLYEQHEGNNRSVRIVRLPYRDGPQHC